MRAIAVALLCGLAFRAGAQNAGPQPQGPGYKSDWEAEQDKRNFRDGDVRLPEAPRNENLIEFPVSASSSFRFYIDSASLSLARDDVVRYTMVARSPSGVLNVSYEGIRCTNKTYRVYALLGSDGRWQPGGQEEWREIEAKRIQRWHNSLYMDYFCPRGLRAADVAEALQALRNGGHPSVMEPANSIYR